MVILGIESSCDEFSVAISRDGKILTNIIYSQINDHIKYGGVVPELASRLHVKNFDKVLNEALCEAKVKITEITNIVYTKKPGLIGSLIVGCVVAKTIAQYLNVPIMGLDHIEGHIYAANIEQKLEYPLLSLVVSGGHTQLELLKKPLSFDVIGSTQDDAIGECYDKVARVLGLDYPGGPKIDKLSLEGDENKYSFPKIMNDESLDFSFSGLKTGSINLLTKLKNRNEDLDLKSFAASFQKTAINSVISKLEKAINKYQNIKMLSIAGGVSANKALRLAVEKVANKYNLSINIPNLSYCTDNAAMICELGYQYLTNKKIKAFNIIKEDKNEIIF